MTKGSIPEDITKINSKWIKDFVKLVLRPGTIEFLEENTEKSLLDVGLGNDFFGYDIEVQAT